MGGAHSLPESITPYPVVANIDFAEGPIFDDAGNLYFVNYLESGTLGRMAPERHGRGVGTRRQQGQRVEVRWRRARRGGGLWRQAGYEVRHTHSPDGHSHRLVPG